AAHADLERLLADRHIGEQADPDLAAALHGARHGAARSFDLARGHARAAGGLEAVLTEGNVGAAHGVAGVAALGHLAEFGALGWQHVRSLSPRSAARPAPQRAAQPPARLRPPSLRQALPIRPAACRTPRP